MSTSCLDEEVGVARETEAGRQLVLVTFFYKGKL